MKLLINLINNMPYPKPREINDNIPESVEEIIMKLLKRNPEERYQNVREVKRDFEEVLRMEITILFLTMSGLK